MFLLVSEIHEKLDLELTVPVPQHSYRADSRSPRAGTGQEEERTPWGKKQVPVFILPDI